jgi:hypothetical protein
MGLFRGNQDPSSQPAGPQVQSELDRLRQLSLTDLASEIMTKGYGPGGPGADSDTGFGGIARAIVPDYMRADQHTIDDFLQVIAEGVQVLEHASLVRFSFWGGAGSGPLYAVTRFGQQTLAQNTVDRVLKGASA